MKKINLVTITILITVLTLNVSAQKKYDETYFFFDKKFGEQYGVFLTAKNVVSRTDFVKLGLEILNKTDNFLLFYKDQCSFTVNGNIYRPKKEKKATVIKPGSKKVITVKSAGETDYLTEDIDFKPGGIFKFSAEGEIKDMPPFHLPPDKNKINNDVFSLNMLKLKKQTDETIVQFKCKYTGNKIGILTPSNCVLRTENGKEWAPVNSKEKIKILQKNETAKFTVIFKIPGKITDMQFAEMDIVWKNTFGESDTEELNFDNVHLYRDKNKKK